MERISRRRKRDKMCLKEKDETYIIGSEWKRLNQRILKAGKRIDAQYRGSGFAEPDLLWIYEEKSCARSANSCWRIG